MSVRVYLGGEGPNELGSFARHPSYQNVNPQPGVVETLLRSVEPEGWEVVGAVMWIRISKYRAKGPMDVEKRNVLGLALEADRAGAHALAFVRDTDGDPQREQVIHDTIPVARERHPDLKIIGGTPKPLLEAWLLALKGETKTEGLTTTRAVKLLVAKQVPKKDTAAMVDYVRRAAPFKQVARDADGLRSWLKEAEDVLTLLTKPAVLR